MRVLGVRWVPRSTCCLVCDVQTCVKEYTRVRLDCIVQIARYCVIELTGVDNRDIKRRQIFGFTHLQWHAASVPCWQFFCCCFLVNISNTLSLHYAVIFVFVSRLSPVHPFPNQRHVQVVPCRRVDRVGAEGCTRVYAGVILIHGCVF